MSFDELFFGLLATLFLLHVYIISGATSGWVDCTTGNFLSDRDCIPCPEGCKSCNSTTDCAKCVEGRYGPACQNNCTSKCLQEECHKEYGHCSEGCPDGEFANLTTKECERCPATCDICSAPTNCITCKPGHFNVNGECLKCVDGCASCDNTSTCSTCKNGHIGPFDGRCAINCKEANKTWMITKSNDDHSLDFPKINCAQIPPDKESSTYHVIGNCFSEVNCPEGVRCHVDGKNVITEASVCGISETYRCMVDCQRLNGTSCQCHVMCSSWTFRQQHTPTCPRDSDEHFNSSKRTCYTVSGDQADTRQTQPTTSMPPCTSTQMIFLVIFFALTSVAMAIYIVCMKRKSITDCVRRVRRTCFPLSANTPSSDEEGRPKTGKRSQMPMVALSQTKKEETNGGNEATVPML